MAGLFGGAVPSAYVTPRPQHSALYNAADSLLGGWISYPERYKAQQEAQERYRTDRANLSRGLFGGPAPAVEVPAAPEVTADLMGAPKVSLDTGALNAPRLPPTQGVKTLQEALPLLGPAVFNGVPGAKDLVELLDKSGPQIDVVNGVAYDKRNIAPGSRVGVSLQNVNGTLVDTQDRNNANRFIPEAPTKGAAPLYDESGKPVAWRMMDGSLQAIGQSAAAESGGRAAGTSPYDVITVPTPDGSTVTLPKSQFLGGAGGRGPAAGAPRIGQSQSPADAVYRNKGAEASAARYKGIQDAGNSADTRIGQFRQLQTLLGDFEGGRLAETGVEIASALNSVGVNIDKNLGNKQAAQALSSDILLSKLGGSLGPGVSNSDVTFLQKTAPGISQSSSGRKQMLNYGIAIAGREKQVANFASRWEERYGRIDARDAQGRTFDDSLRVWAAKNPLFPEQGKK